jgi:hypothetical protein
MNSKELDKPGNSSLYPSRLKDEARALSERAFSQSINIAEIARFKRNLLEKLKRNDPDILVRVLGEQTTDGAENEFLRQTNIFEEVMKLESASPLKLRIKILALLQNVPEKTLASVLMSLDRSIAENAIRREMRKIGIDPDDIWCKEADYNEALESQATKIFESLLKGSAI